MTLVYALLLLVSPMIDPSGHWEGIIHGPNVAIEIDLARNAKGELAATFTNTAENVRGFPLSNVAVDGTSVTFEIKARGGGVFHGSLSGDRKRMTGTFATRGPDSQPFELPFELTRKGNAKIEAAPASAAVSKDLEGSWSGTIEVEGKRRGVGLKLLNHADGTSTGVVISSEGVEIPIFVIKQKGTNVTLDVKQIAGSYTGTLNDNGTELVGTWTQSQLVVPLTFRRVAASSAIDRWANALGGREKIAAIRSIYREATLEWGGFEGSLKAWHTADGKYRKEEQVATFASIETFDGTNGTVQQGSAPPHKMADAELERARSSAFANWNAVFFVFFPERRRGTVDVEGDTIVLKPEGGIEWRVMLDPETSLPKSMTHKEGDRTITVTFVSYETIDGIKIEKEIRRSMGEGKGGAVIRFTKTLFNPPVDAALFAMQ